jgi:hypothetical protein
LISPIRGFGLIAIALLLTGCAQTSCFPGPYLDARALPPLVVPDGMDAPDRQMALRVPAPRGASDRPGDALDGCIPGAPPFFAEAGEPNPEGLPVRPGSMAVVAGQPRAAPTRVSRDVIRFIEDWAETWGRRDFDAWVQFYEPDFTPEGYESHAAWRNDQARRFEVAATTLVEPDSVRVNVLPDGNVRARFVQQFGIGEEVRAVVKELVLMPRPRGSGWLITEDYVVEIL